MKFTFFIAAHIMLSFGFVTKKVSEHSNVLAIAEQCLHSIKGFSVSNFALLSPCSE